MCPPRRGPLAWLPVALACVLAALAWTPPTVRAQRAGDANASASQEPNKPPVRVDDLELSPESIRRRLALLAKNEQVPPEVREQARGLLEQALTFHELTAEHREVTAALAASAESAPKEIERLGKALAEPAEAEPNVPADADLEQLRATLTARRDRLSAARAEAEALRGESKLRQERRAAIPQKLAAAESQIAQATGELGQTEASGDPPSVKEARRILLRKQVDAWSAERRRYEKQRDTADVRDRLLAARLEKALADVKRLEASVARWDAAVTARQEQETRREIEQAREAEQRATDEPAFVKEALARNTDLSELRAEVQPRRKAVESRLAEVRKRREEFAESARKLRTLADTAGQTDFFGTLLREQRTVLPSTYQLRQELSSVQQHLAEVRVRLYELRGELEEIADPNAVADSTVQAKGEGLSARRREAAARSLRAAFSARKDHLEALIGEYEELYRTLLELSTQQLPIYIDQVEDFRSFIDENVLWIRSTRPLGLAHLRESVAAASSLADPGAWRRIGYGLLESMSRRPVLPALAAVVLGLLVLTRRRLIARLVAISENVVTAYPGTILQTFGAVGITLLLAAGGPLLLAMAGWQLVDGGETGELGYALSRGLLAGAAVLAPLTLIRQVCRRNGLAEAHFRWPASALRRVSANALLLEAVGIPLTVLIAMIEARGIDAHRESLGRIGTIVGLAFNAVILARLLRPGGRFFQDAIAVRKTGWLYKLRHIWYPLVVGINVLLAGAAAAGYYYTALQLSSRLLVQGWVLLVLLLVHALLLRWILLAQRRLALRSIQERKEAAAQQEAQKQQAPADAEGVRTEKPRIDLYAVSQQTRQLARYVAVAVGVVSVWLIWSSVLPALGVLDRVELWRVGSGELVSAITLADIGGALLLVALTAIATRNIPGLLEITILQRLPMDAGGRYAIAAVGRYTIMVVGAVLAFNAIGVGWGQVQWLVAAMTVGLGFGLQEIFANFVSGLIILLERPMRIGDIVTVGGVSGTVTRIQMRATTITDWDRKELVVPNREFITGQLINWTLSDSIMRLVVPVGIAYGSDTAKAYEVFHRVAKDNPRVLDEPPPLVLFLGFGDSALNFEVRVYISSMADWLPTMHEMHMQIDQACRKAGIEIAFPQRDIHVRSITSVLPVRQDPPPAEEPATEAPDGM
jgi:potassium efflux system protein